MSAALEMASAATAMRLRIWCILAASGRGGPAGVGAGATCAPLPPACTCTALPGVPGFAAGVPGLEGSLAGMPGWEAAAGPPTPPVSCGVPRQLPMAATCSSVRALQGRLPLVKTGWSNVQVNMARAVQRAPMSASRQRSHLPDLIKAAGAGRGGRWSAAGASTVSASRLPKSLWLLRRAREFRSNAGWIWNSRTGGASARLQMQLAHVGRSGVIGIGRHPNCTDHSFQAFSSAIGMRAALQAALRRRGLPAAEALGRQLRQLHGATRWVANGWRTGPPGQALRFPHGRWAYPPPGRAPHRPQHAGLQQSPPPAAGRAQLWVLLPPPLPPPLATALLPSR